MDISNLNYDYESDPDFYESDGSWMDADALASAGWGTDEDYGGYEDNGFDGWMEE